jgi:hypothetical protein
MIKDNKIKMVVYDFSSRPQLMHLLDESISNHAKLCTNPVLQLIG